MSELDIEPNKTEYKTPDYVRRAVNKYRNKKYNEDEKYRNHHIEMVKLNYEKNKEKYREQRKAYMREYRARKKAEKEQKPAEPSTTSNLEDSIKSLDIKN
jgi:hypothetical protein